MHEHFARPYNARVYSMIRQDHHPTLLTTRQAAAAHAYEEFKKILILAGAFFFILIICIMSKLQVGTEDVLRWSPIVWLIGVCTAGAVMNFVFYCQRKYKERKRQQRQLQRDQLYSLPIPLSFPCLAPPPHIDCCRAGGQASTMSLPTYDDVIRCKVEEETPPAYSDAMSMLQASP